MLGIRRSASIHLVSRSAGLTIAAVLFLAGACFPHPAWACFPAYTTLKTIKNNLAVPVTVKNLEDTSHFFTISLRGGSNKAMVVPWANSQNDMHNHSIQITWKEGTKDAKIWIYQNKGKIYWSTEDDGDEAWSKGRALGAECDNKGLSIDGYNNYKLM
jgi:hypothetical protein